MLVRSLILNSMFSLLLVASASAKSSCGEQQKVCDSSGTNCSIQCARDGFVVSLPDGWSTNPNADENLSVHLLSSKEDRSIGNCPIASAVNIDTLKGYLDLIESATEGQIGRFWTDVFEKAGLRLIGGTILNQQTIKQDDSISVIANRKSAKSKKDHSQMSLVEAVLQRGTDGKFLRVWQALYFKTQKNSKSGKYIPARIYFVNCTELDPSGPNDNNNKSGFQPIGAVCKSSDRFCRNLEAFDRIFASLIPQECYATDDDTRMKCEGDPSLVSVIDRAPETGAAKPVAQASQGLVDIAARVAASGSK